MQKLELVLEILHYESMRTTGRKENIKKKKSSTWQTICDDKQINN